MNTIKRIVSTLMMGAALAAPGLALADEPCDDDQQVDYNNQPVEYYGQPEFRVDARIDPSEQWIRAQWQRNEAFRYNRWQRRAAWVRYRERMRHEWWRRHHRFDRYDRYNRY